MIFTSMDGPANSVKPIKLSESVRLIGVNKPIKPTNRLKNNIFSSVHQTQKYFLIDYISHMNYKR